MKHVFENKNLFKFLYAGSYCRLDNYKVHDKLTYLLDCLLVFLLNDWLPS